MKNVCPKNGPAKSAWMRFHGASGHTQGYGVEELRVDWTCLLARQRYQVKTKTFVSVLVVRLHQNDENAQVKRRLMKTETKVETSKTET